MRVIIMRHGLAVYQGGDRILSPAGELEALSTGLKLSALFGIDKIMASPKTRAKQTASCVMQKLKGARPELEILPQLSPSGDPDFVRDYVMAVAKNSENVLLISHIPLVSLLTEAFAPGQKVPFFGTACALVVEIQENDPPIITEFITPTVETAI